MSWRLNDRPRGSLHACIGALMLAAIAAFGLATPASAARLVLGTEEELRHIQDVELKTRDGAALYLGYKLSFHWLGLPYAVTDGGYVLGVKGHNRYYTIDQTLMKEWQAQGFLPTTLPKYQIGTTDTIFAHLMWIVLGLLVLWYGGRALLAGRLRATPPQPPQADAAAQIARIDPARTKPAAPPASPAEASAGQRPAEAPASAPASSAAPSAGPAIPQTEFANLPVAKTVARVKSLKK